MANVSKINFNGTVLDIKDAHARDQLTHLTADNYTADVAGDYTVNGGDIAMSSKNFTGHTTADREIDTDGNDSVHIDGASTLNVGGLRTETFAGDKTETVTGTLTEKFKNVNTTVTGKWNMALPNRSFSMADVALNSDVTTAVDAEKTAREAAVNAEKTAREAADAALDAKIANTKAYTHFVVIGDSFSNAAQTGTPLWYTYLEKQYGLTCYTNASDGVGYAVGDTNDFMHQLQTAASALDVSKVKTVYILGGLNDVGNTSIDLSTFTGKVEQTVAKAKTLFPTSEIVVAGIQPFQNYNFYSGSSTLEFKRSRHFNDVLNFYSSKHAAHYINLEYMGLFSPEFFGPANGSNQKHPSSVGSAIIAASIMAGHSAAQGTWETMPELIPKISDGTINITDVSTNAPNQITISLNIKPTSANFNIDWRGFPYAPINFTLSVVGGTSIVGYYTRDGVMAFNNATVNATYYGNYTINV